MKKLIAVLSLIGLSALLAYLFRVPAAPGPKVIALVQLTEVDARTVAGFQAGMAAAGYREGQDVVYLSAGAAGSVGHLDDIIRGHLAKHPDLFMVSSTPAAQRVKRLTEGMTIPIVFAPVNDPVSAGIVADLKHPGGHITGIRLPTGEDVRLKWLTEIAPTARHVFVPYTPGDKSAEASLATIMAAAPRLGVTLLPLPVRDEAGVVAALANPPAGLEAVFLPRDSRIESQIKRFVEFAAARRLPLCAPSLSQVEQGALMSYGFVHEEVGRQAARLADQIFQGVKPGDLPVEMAESILALNTAAARRIGLSLPNDILRQAEKVVGD
ncbi:MAG: hypothetical protein HGA75_04590 [Thiobacillus sp.]|nr:hypothetical protein [Thiobacillus sp.]